MGNNAANVSVGKPVKTGAIFRAPKGTTLPTSTSDTLDSAFSGLGYASEDGVTNSNSPSSTDIKAWGGDVVYSAQTDKPDTFKIKLIESLNTDVMKTVYGDNNVSGSLATGVAISVNSDDPGYYAYVIDMVLQGNTAKRIVIPEAKVTAVSDIVYKDSDIIAYEVTLSAVPDSSGNTHYEYLKTASTNAAASDDDDDNEETDPPANNEGDNSVG